MPSAAGAAYGARLRVQGRLPGSVLVPLIFVRNALLGALALGEDGVAPAVVEVVRLSDGVVIGRITASSSYYEQAGLLAEVCRGLETQSEADFLTKWALGSA